MAPFPGDGLSARPRFPGKSAPKPDFAELRRRVRAAGLLKRSYGYYTALTLGVVAGFALVGLLLALAPGIGDVVAVPAIALLMLQVGFLGHDAGHSGIFHLWRHNRIAGLIFYPATLGISFENWVAKHNAHHAHTNEVDADPDINNPIVASSPERLAERRGIYLWVARHQAYLYFLLATLLGFRFRADTWYHAIRGRARATTRLELGLIVVNLLGWFVLPAVLLGPVRWLIVFGIAQLLVGVGMAAVFAPNHKGMPLVRGERPSFLEQQVRTSRNVTGGPIVDFLYGGLNYQIEHHLFPNLARNRLPACREVVKAFCAEVGLPYAEQGVLASYRSLLRSLDAVGKGKWDGAEAM